MFHLFQPANRQKGSNTSKAGFSIVIVGHLYNFHKTENQKTSDYIYKEYIAEICIKIVTLHEVHALREVTTGKYRYTISTK